MEFTANVDNVNEVSNEVGPFAAQYLRVHPTQWNEHVSLRLDVSACVFYADGIATLSIPNRRKLNLKLLLDIHGHP